MNETFIQGLLADLHPAIHDAVQHAINLAYDHGRHDAMIAARQRRLSRWIRRLIPTRSTAQTQPPQNLTLHGA
jgi:hypothetical protein